ncbi:hypothetical protein N7495_009588 [Penicillium taxi]|uniref:uncharacterized protein n=1 Tax=Penicillium taxi TaxID=168475 RepID=UPI00254538EE|nr:uncharacterized protein N7495_009588 [Penicillium taxi]KAJ5885078.1 hypothetical protein N7495_009588 [Penicillium taxi]
MVPRRRFSRRFAVVAAGAVLLFLWHVWSLQSDLQAPSGNTKTKTSSSSGTNPEYVGEPAPICPPFPGIDDVLVVMKTGVTEARDKVPIHFQTTLRCIPHYVIYSDFEEVIEGVTIHDAFRTMDPEVMERVPDFDIYNRIARSGRQGLEQNDFADEDNSAIGKPNNPGWKLDKWKFLPMAQEALQAKPDAKWFVFMEADTYVSWPTLLAWLARFNPSDPLYIGTETQIADVIFAHGGSGFILSNSGLTAASNEYEARRAELDEFTNGHWAGDCVLGKVLADAGVQLLYSWPILQNSNIGELDEFDQSLYRNPWCYASVAFHHLSSTEIQDLWKFEKKRWHDKNKRILLHSDMFREFIFPQIAAHPSRLNWDNFSEQEDLVASTFEECEALCETKPLCVQYSFRDGKCFTNDRPRLGVSPKHGQSTSGWLTSRIRNIMDEKGLCRQSEFGL